MKRTYEEINRKIEAREAVVMTAEEVLGLIESKGIEKATKEVDVVTTGTFGAMCPSGRSSISAIPNRRSRCSTCR